MMRRRRYETPTATTLYLFSPWQSPSYKTSAELGAVDAPTLCRVRRYQFERLSATSTSAYEATTVSHGTVIIAKKSTTPIEEMVLVT